MPNKPCEYTKKDPLRGPNLQTLHSPVHIHEPVFRNFNVKVDRMKSAGNNKQFLFLTFSYKLFSMNLIKEHN